MAVVCFCGTSPHTSSRSFLSSLPPFPAYQSHQQILLAHLHTVCVGAKQHAFTYQSHVDVPPSQGLPISWSEWIISMVKDALAGVEIGRSVFNVRHVEFDL